MHFVVEVQHLQECGDSDFFISTLQSPQCFDFSKFQNFSNLLHADKENRYIHESWITEQFIYIIEYKNNNSQPIFICPPKNCSTGITGIKSSNLAHAHTLTVCFPVVFSSNFTPRWGTRCWSVWDRTHQGRWSEDSSLKKTDQQPKRIE